MKSFREILDITEAKKSGTGWKAKCRAHDDPSPSLSIDEKGGRVLLHCFGGCDTESVLSAYGLSWADINPERQEKTETTWEIRDADGRMVAEHIRLEDGAKKRFVWKRGGKGGLAGMPAKELPLYRSEYVSEYDATKAIFVTEGEKAADAASKLGLQSLGTVCGASAIPGRDALGLLCDRHVILWPDFDDAGLEHMNNIAEALSGVARSVKWLHQPDAKPKDDAADYAGTLDELKRCVRAQAPTLGGGPLRMIADAVTEAQRELDKIQDGDLSDYVPTGVGTLDRRLGGGFRRGQMILIGAASGQGKTSLVVQFSMAAALKGLALVVSPEMSTEELATREIVRRSGYAKWKRAPWSFESERIAAMNAHNDAAYKLKRDNPRVAVFDSLSVKLEDVFAAAREAHKKTPLSLIALDYAQQLADEESTKSRHLLVGDVGHKALAMAREFYCPVLVTSQVNVHKDGRGKEYSFRESAILEHKAHLSLLFLVERDDKGKVLSAEFRARKARDLPMIHLEVEYDPSTFSVSDYGRESVADVRDWTGER